MTTAANAQLQRVTAFSRRVILGLAAISCFTVTAAAQGICVPERLTVKKLHGRVVSQLERGESPLPGASVTLLRNGYRGRRVAGTRTDENGNFDLGRVRRGKYVLKISYSELVPFYVGVDVVNAGTPRQKDSRREIVVTMGADFVSPCGGSRAEVKDRS